jgi:hypothetical protein
VLQSKEEIKDDSLVFRTMGFPHHAGMLSKANFSGLNRLSTPRGERILRRDDYLHHV